MKTNKSVTKRLKITRTGKVLRRRPGRNHFNAKERRIRQIEKRNWTSTDKTFAKKVVERYVPNK